VLKRIARWIGWLLVAAGLLVLLYIVYLLWYTNRATDSAQRELREQWEAAVVDPALVPPPAQERDEPEPVELGDAYALLWFERPGEEGSPVNRDPIFVVRGVSLDVLRRGPGHYPESVPPGGDGNFAIAGHRTTYGAPFYYLDELQPGDEVHVVDRDDRHWRYVVTEVRVVSPGDVWVVGPDPRGDGRPLLTLTTCHPRFSASQRLVVWAELDAEVTDDVAA
jgi:sortase A